MFCKIRVFTFLDLWKQKDLTVILESLSVLLTFKSQYISKKATGMTFHLFQSENKHKKKPYYSVMF